jgi:molybdenum cofactor biosynthesis enzyme MoaA
MSDLISRQMAIDAAMQDVSDKRSHDFNAGATRAANRIKQLTSAEREIIQCKDCIYARMTIDGDFAKYCLAWQDSLMDSLYLPADFYCGFAERKEE